MKKKKIIASSLLGITILAASVSLASCDLSLTPTYEATRVTQTTTPTVKPTQSTTTPTQTSTPTATGTQTSTTPVQTFKVTYNTNGHGDAPAEVTGVSKLPETLPTLDDEDLYRFKGWSNAADSTTLVTPGAAIEADTTLYAVWQKLSYYEYLLESESLVYNTDFTNDTVLEFDKDYVPLQKGVYTKMTQSENLKAEIKDGKLTLFDNDSTNPAVANIEYGFLYDGVVEGTLKITPTNTDKKTNGSWTLVQFEGYKTFSDASQLFALRTNGSAKVQLFINSTSSFEGTAFTYEANKEYEVYWKYDFATSKFTAAIDDNKIVEDFVIPEDSRPIFLSSTSFITAGSDTKRGIKVADFAVVNRDVNDLAKTKAHFKDLADEFYSSIDLTKYGTNASQVTAYFTQAKTKIDAATTRDQVLLDFLNIFAVYNVEPDERVQIKEQFKQDVKDEVEKLVIADQYAGSQYETEVNALLAQINESLDNASDADLQTVKENAALLLSGKLQEIKEATQVSFKIINNFDHIELDINLAKGAKISNIENPWDNGLVLKGWSTDSGVTILDSDTIITDGMECEAVWVDRYDLENASNFVLDFSKDTKSDDNKVLTDNFKTAEKITIKDENNASLVFNIGASSSNMKIEANGLKFQKTDTSLSFTTTKTRTIELVLYIGTKDRSIKIKNGNATYATITALDTATVDEFTLDASGTVGATYNAKLGKITLTINNAPAGTYSIASAGDYTIYTQKVSVLQEAKSVGVDAIQADIVKSGNGISIDKVILVPLTGNPFEIAADEYQVKVYDEDNYEVSDYSQGLVDGTYSVVITYGEFLTLNKSIKISSAIEDNTTINFNDDSTDESNYKNITLLDLSAATIADGAETASSVEFTGSISFYVKANTLVNIVGVNNNVNYTVNGYKVTANAKVFVSDDDIDYSGKAKITIATGTTESQIASIQVEVDAQAPVVSNTITAVTGGNPSFTKGDAFVPGDVVATVLNSNGIIYEVEGNGLSISINGQSNVYDSATNTFIDKGTVEVTVTYLDATTTYEVTVALQTYKVTLDYAGGQLDGEDITKTNLVELTRLPDAKREGYTFDGWFDENDVKVEASTTTPYELTSDLALTAKWTEKAKYTISFAFNITGVQKDSIENQYKTPDTLEAPEVQGYKFVNWYSDYNYQTLLTLGNDITEATTIYGKYEAIKYNIVFNANGGTGTMAKIENVEYGENQKLTKNTFTKVGCEFIGWATTANADAVEFVDEEEASNLTKVDGTTVTLYAQWEVVRVMYVFGDSNFTSSDDLITNVDKSGDVTENTTVGDLTITASSDKKVTFGSNSGTLDGYSFTNALKLSGTAGEAARYVKIDLSKYTGTARVTIYGISANSNTRKAVLKTDPKDISGATDGLITISTNNTIAKGFATLECGTGKVYYLGSVNSGFNIFAIKIDFSEQIEAKYTIHFDANGGNGTMADLTDCDYSTEYSLTKNTFTNGTKTFAGWATSADGDVEYADEAKVKELTKTNGATVTLYAKWTDFVLKTNVTFTSDDVVGKSASGTNAFENTSKINNSEILAYSENKASIKKDSNKYWLATAGKTTSTNYIKITVSADSKIECDFVVTSTTNASVFISTSRTDSLYTDIGYATTTEKYVSVTASGTVEAGVYYLNFTSSVQISAIRIYQ